MDILHIFETNLKTINMKEKDLTSLEPTKKPMYTNSKGDKFYKGDKLYWGDTDDCEVDSGSIFMGLFVEDDFKEDDESTEVFKTEEEAARALIEKLGKKEKKGNTYIINECGQDVLNISSWNTKKLSMNFRHDIYLKSTDFAKLVVNGVIK